MAKKFYEHSLWRLMKDHKPDYIVLDRVEAKMPIGLPDIQGHGTSLEDGIFQIELKAMDQWPLVTTKLGLRPEQLYYLNKKGRYCQPVYLFAKVGDDFLLVHGSNVGNWTKREWFSLAKKVWYKQVDWKEFYKLIYS